MKAVDELMYKCPLKHEIRVSFWEPFIRRLDKKHISYLTLYSPPLMDVKYFYHKGLIEAKEGVFSGVVGVGIDAESEAESNSEVNFRLDLLLNGNIDELLDDVKSSTEKKKQLKEKFPFDVINLDYVDTLHKKKANVDISPHIQAIDVILDRQKKSNIEEFILFVTTCVNIEHYNEGFLTDLKEKFDDNIRNTPKFVETLEKVCSCKTSQEYQKKNSNDFLALSMTKYFLLQLKDHGFTIDIADVRWLIRDTYKNGYEKNMLHLAFHIKKFKPKTKRARSHKDIGKRNHTNDVEHYSVKLIKNAYKTLRVSTDSDALTEKHQSQIEDIWKINFEISTPSIKTN